MTPLHLLTEIERKNLRWSYPHHDRGGVIRFAKSLADGCADVFDFGGNGEPTADIEMLAKILSDFSANTSALLTCAVMTELERRTDDGLALRKMLLVALLDAMETQL